MDDFPSFTDLSLRRDAPPGSSWGVFGDDDELGTLNFITPASVAAAARLVRKGAVFPLNLDLSLPRPAFFGRETPRHAVTVSHGGRIVDDRLDRFYPQSSSHWDGLRHCAHREHGFYNRAPADAVAAPGPGRLAMEHWARRGIAGRAVVLDVPRALAGDGGGFDPLDFFPITTAVIERVAEVERVEFSTGDVVLVRTGWLAAYLELTAAERARLAAEGDLPSPGLSGSDVPAFLWSHRVAAVAADNPALEASRPVVGVDMDLHERLLALLGMPLGELWNLEALAADCAEDGVYEAFLTSSPLNLAGGVGSPANALALK